MRGFLRALALAVLFAAGCAPEPRTQIMVVVDAEPGVRAEADALEVTVFGGPSDEALADRGTSLFEDPRWPIELALIPEDNDARRRYRVVARARDGASAGAEADVGSGYVAGEVRALYVLLRDVCRGGGAGCGPTTVEPGELPRYAPDAGAEPLDAGPGDGGRVDGGGLDGGPIDAGAFDGGAFDGGTCDALEDCDDGLACNGEERCVAGRCVPGVPVLCPPSDQPCTRTQCLDPAGGCMMVQEPAGTACDDGIACTVEDTCRADGICVGTSSCPETVMCLADGTCGCPSGSVLCEGGCRPGICCPGTTEGECGRCGTFICNGTGDARSCGLEQGVCDPGDMCFGQSCSISTGEACPDVQRRECQCDCGGVGCQWSECL